LRRIAKGADLLVAADSGLIACEDAGLKPDWVLGDMDSLAGNLKRLDKYPPEKLRRFPSGKDQSDTELAIALLREKGCDEIWISGGGGGRIDHLFAIYALFEREDPPDRWFPGPGKEEIRCLKEGGLLSAKVAPSTLVSVFPLAHGPWEAESSGLKWPLEGLSWERGSLGLSNEALTGSFEIRSIRGRFMVIMPESSYCS
jgi:thiamine pyrophosphokinase